MNILISHLKSDKKAIQTHFIVDCCEALKFEKLKYAVNFTNGGRKLSAHNNEEQYKQG